MKKNIQVQLIAVVGHIQYDFFPLFLKFFNFTEFRQLNEEINEICTIKKIF